MRINVSPAHLRLGLCWLTALLLSPYRCASGFPEGQVARVLNAPRANVKMQIDALPIEWAMTAPLAVGSREQVRPKTAWDGPHDLSALIRCMWDEDALYALIEVCDSNVVISDEISLSDHLVIWLGEYGIRVVPPFGKQGARAFDARTNLQLLEDGTWAASANGDSWSVELRITWDKLAQPNPEGGTKLALSLEVNDVDSFGDKKTLNAADMNCITVVLDDRAPSQLLTDTGVLSGACLIETSTSELVPNTELQIDILFPRLLLGISGVEAAVVDDAGNELEMKPLHRERCGIFWRWRYSWLIPPEAQGNYSLKLSLLGADNKLLTVVAYSIGSTVHISTLDMRMRIDELVSEARSQTFRARRLGDEVACGRWATLWLHAGRLQDDFTRMTNEEPTLDAAKAFLARLSDLQGMRKNILSGKDPFDGRSGVIERAYLSELDNTLQPYSVYIPPIYHDVLSGKPVKLPNELTRVLAEDEELAKALDLKSFRVSGFPMVVQLHGLGGTHGISSPPPSSPLWAVIILSPYGRGPTDYKLWGEADVIRAIKEVMRTYRVDGDRVYMTGVSMGGTGCWQIATHYPDVFAAIAPVCGNADHRVWEREWNWGQHERTFMTDVRNFLENCESPVFLAENLMHVPVYCVHGDADDVVPVGHSRSMVGRLRELGYSVIYDEQKGVGHGGFRAGTFEKLHAWMLKQVRNRYPKRVVYKTGWLRYSGAYWVEINRFERYLNFAIIDAEVVSPNAISVRTSNVAHFTLRLNDNIVDTTKPVSISIDGEFVYRGGVGRDGSLSFAKRCLPDGTSQWVPSAQPHGMVKSARLEGPIEAAFLSHFIIAYGTVGDDSNEVEVNEAEARKLAAHWARWASGRAIVKRDVDVTSDDIANANIVLIGNLKSNHIVRQVNSFLPIRFDVGSNAVLMANGLRFEGDDVGINLVYPNPLNPKKLIVILGGTTWKGTFDVVRRFGNWFDWGVLDHRKWYDFAIYDARTRDAEAFLAVGFFDQDWMLSGELTFYGDAKFRQATPPHSPPNRRWAGALERAVYLSDLKPINFSSDKGPLGIDRTTDGYQLTLGGRQYSKGLSVHPDAEIVYDIGGRFKAFECVVGIDTSGEKPVSRAREQAETVTFQIFGDGKLLAEVTDVKWNTPPKRIMVSVEGVSILKLVARRQSGARWLYGKVDFADAKLLNDTMHQPDAFGAFALSKAIDGEVYVALPRSLYQEIELNDSWRMRPASYGEGVERGWHEKPFEVAEDGAKPPDDEQLVADAKLKGEPEFEPQGEQPDLQQWQFGLPADLGGADQKAEIKGLELQVKLPMSVHGALIQHGILQDPCIGEHRANDFLRENKQLRLAADEVGEFEWWLQRVFQVPEDWRYRVVLLELNGVSYQADVWVNGKPAGNLRGMWQRRSFDITTLLNFGGENLLSIRLTDRGVPWTCSPRRIEPPKPYEALLPSLFDGESGGMKLIPIGIWQPIKLRTVGMCMLSNLRIKTLSASLHEALVRVAVTAVNMHPQRAIKVMLHGQIGGCGFVWGQQIEPQVVELSGGEAKDVVWYVRLGNPRLWWTHDLLQASVYQIVITATLDGGIVTDELRCEFGIRKVEVAPPQAAVKVAGGMVRLNGERFVPIKGTTWVASDQLLRFTEERYERLLKRLIQLGFNCLYVSGTTLPESDSFYSLCDRYGIFVIQELPISAIDLSRIKRDELLEAVRQLALRLRNHPSLLMWSLGVSEAQEAQAVEFVQKLMELLASVDDERMIVVRLEWGKQNCIAQRATDDALDILPSMPLLLYMGGLPPAKVGSDSVHDWLATKSAVERMLSSANYGGFIIGQFNEPRIGSGRTLVQYDGGITPPAYAFARALRSELLLAFNDNAVCVMRQKGARGKLDAALQVVVCDRHGSIRQSIVLMRNLHPGERRTVKLSEICGGLLDDCLIGAGVYVLGERAPSFVTVSGNIDIVQRLAEGDVKCAAHIGAVPIHKAIWVAKDVNAANSVASAIGIAGTQIKVVPVEDVIADDKVLTSALEEVDAIIVDGEAVKAFIHAGVDERVGEAIAKAVWRGIGLLFNGLPEVQIGEAPLSGHIPSLMPAVSFLGAAELVEADLKVEEPEHIALKWLNTAGAKIRRCEMRVIVRRGAIVIISDNIGTPILIESAYGKGRVLAWVVNIASDESAITPASFAQGAFALTLLYACKAPFAAMRALAKVLQGVEREPTEGALPEGERWQKEPIEQPQQFEGEQQFEEQPFGERWGIGTEQFKFEGLQQPTVERQQVEQREAAALVEGMRKGQIGLIEVSIEPKTIELTEDGFRIEVRIKNGFAFPMPAVVIEGELDGLGAEFEDNMFDMMPMQEKSVWLSLGKAGLNGEKVLQVKVRTLIGDVKLLLTLQLPKP